MTNEDWDANMDEPEDEVGDPIVEDEDDFVGLPDDPDEDLPDSDPAPED